MDSNIAAHRSQTVVHEKQFFVIRVRIVIATI